MRLEPVGLDAICRADDVRQAEYIWAAAIASCPHPQTLFTVRMIMHNAGQPHLVRLGRVSVQDHFLVLEPLLGQRLPLNLSDGTGSRSSVKAGERRWRTSVSG